MRRLITSSIVYPADDDDVALLGAHLRTCRSCGEYRDALLAVTKQLSECREAQAEAELPIGFHQRLLERLSQPSDTSGRDHWQGTLASWFKRCSWEALTAIVVLAGIYAFEVWRTPPPATVMLPPNTPSREALLVPTSLASYRRAAEVSLETLDQLLNEQASRSRSSPEFRLSDVKVWLAESAGP